MTEEDFKRLIQQKITYFPINEEDEEEEEEVRPVKITISYRRRRSS